MNKKDNRIAFACRRCNKRMFDYVAGDLDVHMEFKCDRCKRVMVLKKYSEALIRKEAVNGTFKI